MCIRDSCRGDLLGRMRGYDRKAVNEAVDDEAAKVCGHLELEELQVSLLRHVLADKGEADVIARQFKGEGAKLSLIIAGEALGKYCDIGALAEGREVCGCEMTQLVECEPYEALAGCRGEGGEADNRVSLSLARRDGGEVLAKRPVGLALALCLSLIHI